MTNLSSLNTGFHGGNRSVGRRCTVAFTITEMLAVLAVLAVVAAATVPVLTSLSKGSSRRAAVSQVMSALDNARGLALSRNTVHYLVLADTATHWPENFRCRAFAIFAEEFNAEANRYICLPVTPWTLLPEGISFDPTAGVGEKTIFNEDATKVKVFYQPAGAQVEVPCFKFNSLGTLEDLTDPDQACVRLFEGIVDRDGKVRPTNNVGLERTDLVRVSLVTGRARRVEAAKETPLPEETSS